MMRRYKLNALQVNGESLKAAVRRVLAEGRVDELARDGERWLIGKETAMGKTRKQALAKVLA